MFKVHDSHRDRRGKVVVDSVKLDTLIEKSTEYQNIDEYSEDDKVKNLHKDNKNLQEEKVMKKTMKIEGMMCGHCEASVKKALEALDGVNSAEVSHEAGTAVVELSEGIQDEVLQKAIEDKDYKVLSIE